MKNKIQDLRDHLFATLEQLRDEDKPMDLARAKAIADVAQVIVNSATVEVRFIMRPAAWDRASSLSRRRSRKNPKSPV